jgi:putative transposase
MCHVLGVSENGYYNWRMRGKSKRKWDDEQLAERIEDAYNTNRGKYGSPRIHAELKAQGIQNGAKTNCSINARKTAVCTKKEKESANDE